MAAQAQPRQGRPGTARRAPRLWPTALFLGLSAAPDPIWKHVQGACPGEQFAGRPPWATAQLRPQGVAPQDLEKACPPLPACRTEALHWRGRAQRPWWWRGTSPEASFPARRD